MARHDCVNEADGRSNRAAFTSACSNFSIQYNYACSSIAVAIMVSHRDVMSTDHPDYPQPQWAENLLLSAVFIGSVLGMLTMGYLGDLLGIRIALMITNSLTVVGALGSALLSWGSPEAVWGVIMASRFLLGVGVGGNYPLSAAKASEAAPAADEAVAKAAAAFFWQGPGGLAPYALALLLLQMPRFQDVTSCQFRILLGAGALPACVVWAASMCAEPDGGGAALGKRRNKDSLSESLGRPRHRWTLIGTAGVWFFFDVAFYGTVIFSPTIQTAVFGEEASLTSLCLRAGAMSFLGILGTVVGLCVLPRVGPKALATNGLWVAAALFAAFAVVYRTHPEWSYTLFFIMGLLFFVLYLAPNIATYVLPVVSFPANVRSTFHGLSSAAGKLGAMTGALLFPLINDAYGIPAVMAVQATACAIGALLSATFIEDAPQEEEDYLEEEAAPLCAKGD